MNLVPRRPSGLSPGEKSCVLCQKSDEDDVTGNLGWKEGVAAHQNCLLFASNLFSTNSPIYDDLFGFNVKDVTDEQKRGKKLKCGKCKRRGATVGCEVKRCSLSFHYPCAIQADASIVEDSESGIYKMFCKKHSRNPPQSNAALPINYGTPSTSAISDDDSGRPTIQPLVYSDSDSYSDVNSICAPIESDPESPSLLSVEGKNNLFLSRPEKEKSVSPIRPNRSPAVATVTPEKTVNPGSEDLLDDQQNFSNLLSELSARKERQKLKNVSFMERSSGSNPGVNPCPEDAPPAKRPKVRFMHLPQSTPKTSASRELIMNRSTDGREEHGVVLGHVTEASSTSQPPRGTSSHQPEPEASAASDLSISTKSFWTLCNQAGLTKIIFTELISLGERIQSQEANAQDYDVSLKILKASGELPRIIQLLKQDVEKQETELQQKKDVLRDVGALP